MILQSDKRVFFDNDGNVLENGYIYVGQPGTNPATVANRKTVTFTDAGGSSFTAQQPLRTIGGKIVYNGLPIIATVDGEHSLLVRDSNENQVEYSSSITDTGGGGSVDLSDTIRVGLVLDDVKGFDVAVGDVVRSVGSVTATDNLGADWLVISSTGNPGDDVDLIDFYNGLQGSRDKSKVYSKDGVGTHFFSSPVSIVSITNATSYREVWTEIDLSASVPQTASAAIVRVYAYAAYPSSGIASKIGVAAHVRKANSSEAPTNSNMVGISFSENPTTELGVATFLTECTVPLVGGVAAAFNFYLGISDPTAGAGNCISPDLSIFLVGYVISPD